MSSRKQQPFVATSALMRALRNIAADRRWPIKVLVGGALTTTIFGLPYSWGYEIDSMDNARRGFPTPLPFWSDFGTKYLMGLMAFVIDFAFFALPFFFALLLLFCTAAIELFADTGATFITLIPPIIGGLALLGAFILSFSPAAKLVFVEDGELEKALGRQGARAALRPATRGIYGRARLITLPAYLPALAAGALFWSIISTSDSLLLTALSAWLLNSALLFAHLVVVQVYTIAEESARQAEFAARLAERERALRGEG